MSATNPVQGLNVPGMNSMTQLYSASKPAKEKPRKPKIELSSDQQTALDEIADWLQSSGTAFSLVGPAGSGKTTILREVVKLAVKRKWRVRLTASTHKAVAQAKQATGRSASTAHRILGVALIEDDKTGETGLKAGHPDLDEQSLLVVDEASMLPQRLVDIAVDSCEKVGCKVLFVGDAAQLAPVKELASMTVDAERCPWPLVALTEIHRQAADNPIISAATAVRIANPGQLPQLGTEQNAEGCGVVFVQDKREWRDLLLEQCVKSDEQNRYLGWTNHAVDAAAKAIRMAKYGDDAKNPYLVGERLVVNARVAIKRRALDKGKKKGRKTTDVIENNEEVTVSNVWRDNDRYRLVLETEKKPITVDAFGNYTERERFLSQQAAKSKRSGDWKPFFEWRDSLADLRSSVSMTGHKSQGSTFDDVFINLSEIGKCRNPADLQRLLYVCLTRASRTVYLTGSL